MTNLITTHILNLQNTLSNYSEEEHYVNIVKQYLSSDNLDLNVLTLNALINTPKHISSMIWNLTLSKPENYKYYETYNNFFSKTINSFVKDEASFKLLFGNRSYDESPQFHLIIENFTKNYSSYNNTIKNLFLKHFSSNLNYTKEMILSEQNEEILYLMLDLEGKNDPIKYNLRSLLPKPLYFLSKEEWEIILNRFPNSSEYFVKNGFDDCFLKLGFINLENDFIKSKINKLVIQDKINYDFFETLLFMVDNKLISNEDYDKTVELILGDKIIDENHEEIFNSLSFKFKLKLLENTKSLKEIKHLKLSDFNKQEKEQLGIVLKQLLKGFDLVEKLNVKSINKLIKDNLKGGYYSITFFRESEVKPLISLLK